MSFNILNHSPLANDLLVELYDKHKLYHMTGNDENEARNELANIMADILDVGLSGTEMEMVTDVLLNLVHQAENDLRAAIAQKMSLIEKAPLRLIQFLANEEIDIAKPVLQFSKTLDDMDLLYIVKSKQKEHWQVIASRTNIAPFLAEALVETRDLMTALKISKNKNIQLTEKAATILSDMAETENSLTKPLLARDDLPKELVQKIYSFVGSELKSAVESKLSDDNIIQFNNALSDVQNELAESKAGRYGVTNSMIESAEAHLAKGTLNAITMVDYLKRGQVASFKACFSVFCGLPLKTVEKMLSQDSAQGLAIACKATRIQKTDFANMLLLTTKLRGNATNAHKTLGTAMASFDKIDIETAQSILQASRH